MKTSLHSASEQKSVMQYNIPTQQFVESHCIKKIRTQNFQEETLQFYQLKTMWYTTKSVDKPDLRQ